jgi:hypothetical protein
MGGVVSCTLYMKMPREKAWNILRDLSKPHFYVPGLVKTEITTEKTTGVGASRKVYQTQTKGIDETVVEWNEGHGFLIRLHQGDRGAPPPFSEGHFRYAIEDQGEGTQLTCSLIYTMRWGILGVLLDKLLLNIIMRRVIADVTLSMRFFYETGLTPTKQDLKEARIAWKRS